MLIVRHVLYAFMILIHDINLRHDVSLMDAFDILMDTINNSNISVNGSESSDIYHIG